MTLYKIQMEQRNDKQKPVIDVILESTNNFVVLTGTAYSNGKHRPCWIFEICDDSDKELDLKSCVEKLKKILGTPAISVRRYPSTTQQDKGDNDASNQQP